MRWLRTLRRKASRTGVRVPVVWERHRGLGPKDAFIASYPRSGSTWLRFLLLELLTHNSAAFDSVNQMIPDVGRHHRCPGLLPNGGRLIKTHEVYRPAYRKAVYLVRDVRDVVISEFEYENANQRISEDFEAFQVLFLKGRVNGYGSWQCHVAAWLDSPLKAAGNLLVLKYEDLRSQTEDAVARVVDFLGVRARSDAIRKAIANNDVQRMRAKEDRSPQIAGLSPAKSNGDASRFIRNGAIGGWRSKLSEQQVSRIEQQTAEAMLRIGYSLVTPQQLADTPWASPASGRPVRA
jgi:Sulfotransferase domain